MVNSYDVLQLKDFHGLIQIFKDKHYYFVNNSKFDFINFKLIIKLKAIIIILHSHYDY
jgi:hypothetical protein